MTGTEIWLTYHQISRASRPSTAQLIDLACQSQKLTDLEDVLDYIFAEGFVESKYRSVSYWEKNNGEKVKNGLCLEELLSQGVGRTEETALRLVIADLPPAVWFSYHYTSAGCSVPAVKQRVKIEALYTACHPTHPRVAHLTNHIFQQGYLAKHLRTKVYWETVCGRKVEEHIDLLELLAVGEGAAEEKSLRLVIDDHFHPHHEHHFPEPYPHCPEFPHKPDHFPHKPDHFPHDHDHDHFPHFPGHFPHHHDHFPHVPHFPHRDFPHFPRCGSF